MKKDNLQSKRSTPARRGGLYAVRLPAVVGCTKNGFTMAEILIALTILTIGLVSILSLFPVGLKASKRAGDLNEVALCGQEIFEGLKLCNYGDITLLSPGSTCYSNTISQIPGVSTNYLNYLLYDASSLANSTRYVVNELTAGYLKRIDLTICWIDAGRTNKEFFVTYKANEL